MFIKNRVFPPTMMYVIVFVFRMLLHQQKKKRKMVLGKTKGA
jgi:hypothetical protein